MEVIVKRIILLPLLLAAMAFGTTTVYSVDPVDMAHSAFVNSATEGFGLIPGT